MRLWPVCRRKQDAVGTRRRPEKNVLIVAIHITYQHEKFVVGVYYMYFNTHAGTSGWRGGWAYNTYSMVHKVFHTIRVESCFFHLQLVFFTIFTGMNVIYISNDRQSSLNPIIIGSSHHMAVTWHNMGVYTTMSSDGVRHSIRESVRDKVWTRCQNLCLG